MAPLNSVFLGVWGVFVAILIQGMLNTMVLQRFQFFLTARKGKRTYLIPVSIEKVLSLFISLSENLDV